MLPEGAERRALVIDDDLPIRQLVTLLMARHGFAVDSVAKAETALTLLKINTYSVILLDLMMPEMNGFDLIEHLSKEQPAMLDRTIVITAFSRHGRPPLVDETVYAVIRKPFDIDALFACVEACVTQDEQEDC